MNGAKQEVEDMEVDAEEDTERKQREAAFHLFAKFAKEVNAKNSSFKMWLMLFIKLFNKCIVNVSLIHKQPTSSVLCYLSRWL